MKSSYESFIEKNKIQVPEGMEDIFLQFYFLVRNDVLQDINELVFSDLLEFARMTRQIKNIKNKGES